MKTETPSTSHFDSLPVLFLVNKNDSVKFKGVDTVSEKTALNAILTSAQRRNSESVVMPISAIDKTGLEAALTWI